MKTSIAFQHNLINEAELIKDKAACDQLKVDPIWFGLIPFTNEIVGIDQLRKYDQVIPFGSVKLVRMWKDDALPENLVIFYDEKAFDQRTYSKALGNLLLNHRAKYFTLGEIKDVPVSQDVFIKPTSDLKAFSGCIVNRSRTPREEISRIQDASLDAEPVLVAPIRNIVKEFRCVVINGELIDVCKYKEADQIKHSIVTFNEFQDCQEFLKRVQQLYEPGPVYAIDLALMISGELTVVEYNCFNCIGKYELDRVKIYSKILEYVSS